jgi:hypothetical protein
MALHDNPPHRVTTYTSDASRDLGGGTAITYTAAQAALPCSIDTASASERELFAQQGIVVTHKIGILTAAITTAIVRGMKVVTNDRSESYHVRGISAGRTYGSIPPFTYLFVEQQL